MKCFYLAYSHPNPTPTKFRKPHWKVPQNELSFKHPKPSQHSLLHAEKEAFEVESTLIDFIGINNLTNMVKGHHSDLRGLVSLHQVKIEYEAEDAVFDGEVMLININKRYSFDMSEQELYEATRKHWMVGVRRNTIKSHAQSIGGL